MYDANFNLLANYIWSWLFLPGLFTAALILTIGCRGLQFCRFGYCMKQTIGKAFKRQDKSHDGISPFQAASTALGSTVGTGNIVGTAQAICLGGPGTLFWLWTAALISMIVKYAEIVLAIHYRKTVPGAGPMDYIEHGLRSRALALVYGFMALLSSFAMGNIVQVSSIADSCVALIDTIVSGPELSSIITRLAVGLIISALTVLLFSGGNRRITKAAEMLVPLMVIVFIFVTIFVIALNITKVPAAIRTVFIEAFKPGSICAGISGISTAKCIQWGFRRSAFSNEAGLGTSAIAHAAAETSSAGQQGLWGIFEVFADTVVICTCTSLCILCSGITIPWGEVVGSGLFLSALASVYGTNAASCMLTMFIGLFAYTSIMGWALYGTKCAEYVFGSGATKFYCILFVLLIISGSILPVKTVWEIADFINSLMSIPNLLALILLSPVVIRISRDSFS